MTNLVSPFFKLKISTIVEVLRTSFTEPTTPCVVIWQAELITGTLKQRPVNIYAWVAGVARLLCLGQEFIKR